MRKLTTTLILAIGMVAVSFGQTNMYEKPIPANPQSTFVPLTMQQMQIIAEGRANEKRNALKRFNYYVNKSSEYLSSQKWNYTLDLIKLAEDTNYISNKLFYNKGIAYYNLKKKSKLKKVIKKAKKNQYYEVADLLEIQLTKLNYMI